MAGGPTGDWYLSHAFGERYDLPIPLLLFVLGGAAAVLASFVLVLGRDAERAPCPVESVDGQAPLPACPAAGAFALGCLVFLAWVGFVGTQNVTGNLLPTVFWLLVWIGVPLSCGLLGDWTGSVNPFAYLAHLGARPRVRQLVVARQSALAWPDRLSWWPAVGLYFLLACGELIFNLTATLPQVIATGFALYALISFSAGMVFGDSWLVRGEVFSVLFSTWGRLGWFRFGAPGRRGFLGGLDTPFDRSPSRIAFVLLLLISVNFDGLLATPRWVRFERVHLDSAGHEVQVFRLAAFVVLAGVLTLVFGAFAGLAAAFGGHWAGPRAALAGLLPSLLPIAFAYLLAHNLQYLLVNSQLLGPLIGNPLGTRTWPLHLPHPFNDTFEPHPTFLPSAFYWYVAVVVIVGAHILAVVLAHDHLARCAPDEEHARASEYPWVVAMVGYTTISLLLIAQPLTRDKQAAVLATCGGHCGASVTTGLRVASDR